MQTTSSTWKQLAALEYARVETKAIINNVEYTGENMSPPVITRALMQNGVTIGNVVSAVCTFSLQTTNTIPKSAEVQIKMRLTDGAETPTTSEWLPCGTFYIAKRNRDPISGEVAFECYDSLLKGDAVWVPASSTWPQTMTSIVSEFLTILGLELDSRTTIDSTYTLPQPEAGATIRDVLGIIAQYHGANWTITPENKLRMVPIIDAADAAEAETDVIDVDAVVDDLYTMPANEITGIRCTYDDVTTIVGTDTGLVVDASIPGIIAADLIETIGGMEYQPYTLGTAYYDYAVELGDYVRYSDEVSSVLYSESVQIGPAMCGNISAPDVAEVSNEYPYIGNSAKALTIAKAYANEVVEDYDDTLTQQKVFNRLTNNGTAQGMVLYNGQLYMNATYINTGTLTADRISLNTYNPDFLIPDENDSSTLLPNQSISDGWIVQTGTSVTVLEIPEPQKYWGKTIEVSATSIDRVGSGTVSWYTDDDPGALTPTEEVVSWNAPTYGAVDSDGTLTGATMSGTGYKYTRKFTVPNTAVSSYRVAFVCNGVKAITVSTGVSSELGLRYSQNISIDSTGLQVGKFVVNRTGDATFNGDAVFNGAVSGITPSAVGAVAKSGDTMTGRLTFTTTNAIAYQGTKTWYDMIKFIDNPNDEYGNGIAIGGGGAVIIGGGESATEAASQLTTGGNELLYLCNDGDVNVYTNMQNGWASRKTFTFGANGTLTAPAFSGPLTGNVTGNCSGSSGSCTGNAATVSRATFGDSSNGEHNANNIASNGLYYYSSNGPATSIGASTSDGALYCQAYSTSWVGQIAQDYRNGSLFVRGKNNGTWQSWKRIAFSDGTGASGTWGINITGSSASCTGNAATATMPLGFSSRGTGATWGNTTGTSFTTWNDSTGGSIDFRRDNPSSGKLSIKVDGRFYGNEGSNPACLMNSNNGYWGLGSDPDGGYSGWVRAPASGILTSAKNASSQGSGVGSIGAIEWRFASVYADRLYGNATNVVGTVAIGNGGTGATTAAGARSNLGILYKTVTGTTNSGGNISLGLAATRYMVISVATSSSTHISIPFIQNSESAWHATVRQISDYSAVASTSVTLKVVYIDFGSNI